MSVSFVGSNTGWTLGDPPRYGMIVRAPYEDMQAGDFIVSMVALGDGMYATHANIADDVKSGFASSFANTNGIAMRVYDGFNKLLITYDDGVTNAEDVDYSGCAIATLVFRPPTGFSVRLDGIFEQWNPGAIGPFLPGDERSITYNPDEIWVYALGFNDSSELVAFKPPEDYDFSALDSHQPTGGGFFASAAIAYEDTPITVTDRTWGTAANAGTEVHTYGMLLTDFLTPVDPTTAQPGISATLQIHWLRWAADLTVDHYAENWQDIERWCNAARCESTYPDFSTVTFRTPHTQWSSWQHAEENYVELERFSSALGVLQSTAPTPSALPCPSLHVPYKQWAKTWNVDQEEQNLLTVMRWANALPQCCGTGSGQGG